MHCGKKEAHKISSEICLQILNEFRKFERALTKMDQKILKESDLFFSPVEILTCTSPKACPCDQINTFRNEQRLTHRSTFYVKALIWSRLEIIIWKFSKLANFFWYVSPRRDFPPPWTWSQLNLWSRAKSAFSRRQTLQPDCDIFLFTRYQNQKYNTITDGGVASSTLLLIIVMMS